MSRMCVCAALTALVSVSLGLGACSNDDGMGSPRSVVPGAGTGAGGAAGAIAGAAGAAGAVAGAAGAAAGAGGVPAAGGAGAAGLAGSGGQGDAGATALAGSGGTGGTNGAGTGAGGAGSGAAGASGPAMDMDGLRQACVDHINMHRATLGRPPLRRATPEQETCSDMGAQQDGDSGDAHGSAGNCMGLGAQNTCPGYPVRGEGIAGIETSLKGCLDQMWDEGMPPGTISDCIRDSGGCFQDHGHWINMQSETSMVVSCGFYEMSNGRYWMNQDFGR